MIDNFFAKTAKPFFWLAGLLTSLTLSITFAPEQAMQALFHLPVPPDARLIIQHWGFMVFCLGVLMMVAAFKPHLRVAAASFAAIEKCLLVYLTFTTANQVVSSGLAQTAIIDGLLSVYLILYVICQARGCQSSPSA